MAKKSLIAENRFKWMDRERHILLDDKDVDYLQLTKNDMGLLTPQFNQLNFNTPEDVLRSLVMYSYDNWAFAAKVFLNVDLLPFQTMLMSEFFSKSFYIVVATRGFGK